MENKRIMTAESVRKGHPDKFCDQVADAVLDAHLAQDPTARVAVEVFATDGRVVVAGEVTSKAEVKCEDIVLDTIHHIGYQGEDLTSEREISVDISIHEQSPDIAGAVDGDQLGAGDQGIMVGYATNETPEKMPLPVVLAHRICRKLDQMSMSDLGADGKAQVSVLYEGNKPLYVTDVVVSVQHAEDADVKSLREIIRGEVVKNMIPEKYLREHTRIIVNPSGRFVLGGPMADTGLTGRKLAVDQYGPVAHIGGGALSGKDATKVDRSGAYMARYIAKNIVAAKLAERCEVQIAYAIGVAQPVSVSVEAFGTGKISDYQLTKIVRNVFDMRPAAIIDQLDLNKPIYAQLAAYGHYGRLDLSLPWERTDKKEALQQEAKLRLFEV